MISIGLQIIGGATILLRSIAPLTKTKKDDLIVKYLMKFLKAVSLNLEDKKLEIKVSKK